ncbi:hypothetical protein ACJX0J_038636, partial [Zea mays]
HAFAQICVKKEEWATEAKYCHMGEYFNINPNQHYLAFCRGGLDHFHFSHEWASNSGFAILMNMLQNGVKTPLLATIWAILLSFQIFYAIEVFEALDPSYFSYEPQIEHRKQFRTKNQIYALMLFLILHKNCIFGSILQIWNCFHDHYIGCHVSVFDDRAKHHKMEKIFLSTTTRAIIFQSTEDMSYH